MEEAIDKLLVFGGPLLDAILCLVMVIRGRIKDFPALFFFLLLDGICSLSLYAVDSTYKSSLYFRLYIAFDFLSFAVQVWILVEIARCVLRPTGFWVKPAIKPLAWVAGLGAALALATSVSLRPVSYTYPQVLELRAEAFTSLLTCELVIAMMLSAKEVGLPWRSHVMAIGQGLMLWALADATVEGVSAYLGPHSPYYQAFYYIRSLNYFVVVSYWTVSLWRSEPARGEVSPLVRKYVIALHERVQYDLGKAGQ